MIPPKPQARPDKTSFWQHLRLFRHDILSSQPARLYRAWMAEFRTPFFRSELEQFLLLTSRSGADPVAIRGSYAGAMGLPQFMPSSWAKFAVDFDEDVVDAETWLGHVLEPEAGSIVGFDEGFHGMWKSGRLEKTRAQPRLPEFMSSRVSPAFPLS